MAKEKFDVEVRSIDGYRDRVWCSLGKKFNTGNYQSVDVQFGFATDKLSDETLDQTALRCIQSVKRYIKPLMQEVAKYKNNH